MKRDAGFTLVELLVALALSALVSLVLLHGIRLAAAGLDRQARASERLDARQSLDDLLRRTLGSAVAIPRTAGGEFSGTPNGVEFVSAAEDGGPGLYRVHLALDRGRLILRRELAAPQGDPRAAASVVASNLRDFRLAYFGADTLGASPAWHDSWPQLTTLPQTVRVILDRDADPPRPPLIVRLWNGG
ncbi:MAG TPA: prepilin-type N-terminal cleavage/methylation domain-containing protein [Stellaceae bacterium]|nr:prepilin-type N-terminal cleavage/methylation domain-containing protein [Stellaceae bacterium]